MPPPGPTMLRIATRRSALARAQAFQVGRLITTRSGGTFELVPMSTTGDLRPDRAIGEFDTKGLFVDSIREAVRSGDCDLAVHSAKDLPGGAVEDLEVAAYPRRADPRDMLVTRAGYALANLPATATVGTSSARRAVQLLKAKPGLGVVGVRGNLDTRLRKVAGGELDGVVVAAAGMGRLYAPEADGGAGALDLPLRGYLLEPGECLPAAAQGALAIECRSDHARALAAARAIDDGATRGQVLAERAFLDGVGGGCLAAVGALCTPLPGGRLQLVGMLGDLGRRRVLRMSLSGAARDPVALGAALAADVREAFG